MKDWKNLEKARLELVETISKACREVLTEGEKEYIKANLPYEKQAGLGVYDMIYDYTLEAFDIDKKTYGYSKMRGQLDRSAIIRIVGSAAQLLPWIIELPADLPRIAILNKKTSVEKDLKAPYPEQYEAIKASLMAYYDTVKTIFKKFDKFHNEIINNNWSDELKKLYETK